MNRYQPRIPTASALGVCQMKRYEDSEGVLSNEKAKAEYVACDIRTIDAWLERHKDCAVDHNKVTHIKPDYSTKDVIAF